MASAYADSPTLEHDGDVEVVALSALRYAVRSASVMASIRLWLGSAVVGGGLKTLEASWYPYHSVSTN
jgi:hypothetical protein